MAEEPEKMLQNNLMSNKNASMSLDGIKDDLVHLSTILIVPNNPIDLLERLRKFIDISHIESKYFNYYHLLRI